MEQQKDIRRQPFFWDYHDVFDAGLSKHALLVRLYLAKCASGDDRKSFPSLGTIAAKCKLSKSSVQRGLKELEEGGWVQIIQRKDEAQKNFSNLYLLRHPSDDMVTETIPYSQGDYTLWSDRLPPIVPVTTKQELSNKNKSITPKKTYAEFVTMTEDEYNKLVAAHGEDITKKSIEFLDNYKGANGKKYKSDYRAILQWVVSEVKKRNPEPVVTQSRYTDLSIYD